MTAQKNRASASELDRVLGLSRYEMAWTWLHKLRRAMVRPGRDLSAARVEADESDLGYRAAVYGIDAHPIDLEVDMYSSGSARDFVVVGMPDTAVRESRERIKSVLINSGFGYPNKAVTINLAPANVRKEGARCCRLRPGALEVAAAGNHNVLTIGPPGSGKTMLARRLAGILPPLAFEAAHETTKVHSVAGMLPKGLGLLSERPFRSPHHTISDAGLIGGGCGTPRPGAVTLARAEMTLALPSRFMLVVAMNPGPCGQQLNRG